MGSALVLGCVLLLPARTTTEKNNTLPCLPCVRLLPPCRLQLPADRGADLLRHFQHLDFRRHAQRVKQLWASELYR